MKLFLAITVVFLMLLNFNGCSLNKEFIKKMDTGVSVLCKGYKKCLETNPNVSDESKTIRQEHCDQLMKTLEEAKKSEEIE